jgi:nucleoid-associated protein YgaU
MLGAGALEKLVIIAYTDETFSTLARLPPLRIPINPNKYSRSFKVRYNDQKAAGSAGGSPLFDKIEKETVTFEFVFDATGVVPVAPGVVPAAPLGITLQIEALKAVTCAYDGSIHSPYFLKLVWGLLLFKCRLQSLILSYTLFTPNGIPLRATATAAFLGYTDEYELRARTKKSSPDLTHVLTVEAGDTLPLLCDRIYGRSDYYPQVADANGLTGFRDLRPGMQLVFPPLAGHV